MKLLAPLWLLTACVDERGPRAAEDQVDYTGYLYQGPDVSDATRLADGSVVFTLDGVEGDERVVEATQPYGDYPGYWSATLPSGAAYTLRIEAADAYPAIWAGNAPENDGNWFGGALFGGATTQVDDFLAALALEADPTGVTVIGGPWDPDAWDCAAVTIGGAGPHCFYQDPTTGALSEVRQGAFTWFVATGLPGGDVTVDSGLGGLHTYTALAGDLVYAFWFQGAPS